MAWGFWLILGIVIGCVLFFGLMLGMPERPPSPSRRPSISRPIPKPSTPKPPPGSLPVALLFPTGAARA
jgi:hypothetical protein